MISIRAIRFEEEWKDACKQGTDREQLSRFTVQLIDPMADTVTFAAKHAKSTVDAVPLRLTASKLYTVKVSTPGIRRGGGSAYQAYGVKNSDKFITNFFHNISQEAMISELSLYTNPAIIASDTVIPPIYGYKAMLMEKSVEDLLEQRSLPITKITEYYDTASMAYTMYIQEYRPYYPNIPPQFRYQKGYTLLSNEYIKASLLRLVQMAKRTYLRQSKQKFDGFYKALANVEHFILYGKKEVLYPFSQVKHQVSIRFDAPGSTQAKAYAKGLTLNTMALLPPSVRFRRDWELLIISMNSNSRRSRLEKHKHMKNYLKV